MTPFFEQEKMYLHEATQYAHKWNVNDDHVIRIIKSVMFHRDGILNGGSFVEAVVNNNLYEAVSRADSTCLKYLNVIVSAKMFCHVEKFIP